MLITTFFKNSMFCAFWLLSFGLANAETSAPLAFYKFGGDNIGDRVNLDISAYIFHDVNRNGIYDLGDRSMADIVVAVGKGDTAVAAIRSNANGFANFPTSAHLEDASIKETGTYEFMVVPPPGTKITTGNALQIIEVIEVPDTDRVLGAVRMPDPIGIAPYTFIRGTFAGELPAEVTLIEDGEVVKTAQVQPDGQFLIPVDPGKYAVRISEFERPAHITSSPVDIGTMQSTNIETDAATVIDFEGIAPLGLQKVPNGYGGLGWFNLNAMSSQITPGSVGYQNGVTSGATIAYTSSGHPADIYLGSGFDLLEVNLTISWPAGEGEEVKFDYFRGDELITTDIVGLSAYGPISYQPMIEDVTRVSITSLHYWQVIMDDLKVVVD